MRRVGLGEYPVCPACGHIAFTLCSLGVGGLLVHEGKVLLIQRKTQPNAGEWTLPGGYVEGSERPDMTAVRELREETGLQTRVTGLLGIWHFPREGSQNLWYVFGMQLDGPLSELRADGEGMEIEQAGFFSLDEVTRLEKMGPVSLWIIEHCSPQAPPLLRYDPSGPFYARLRNKDTFGYIPPK